MVSLEQLPHPEYLPYPNHYTAGFFESAEAAEAAITELQKKGYEDEDINVFEGERGVDAIDLDGASHTILERYMRKFIKISDSAEWRFLSEADREIKNGHILLCIPTIEKLQKEEVISVFKKSGAYDIRYFTPIYIEEIL